MIKEPKIRASYLYRLVLIAISFLVIVSSIITYSFNLGHEMTVKYAPLVDAAMEIKLEATTGHLKFEEILAGERADNMQLVYQHIENSKWYTRAMLNGGSNDEGIFLPVENKNLEKQISTVLSYLEEFEVITNKRHQYKNSETGNEYNKLFDSLINEADNIETGLQKAISNELKIYNFTYYFILISTFIVTVFAFLFFYNYEKSKHDLLLFLKASNDNLESTKKELLNKNKIINQLANTDKLTQLPNRLKIDAVFDYDIKRAFRYKTIFSIILLDIDSFKEVNDTYGHDVGDYTLIEIANILKENIREIDIPGRFGGEEFIIICPETKAQGAQMLAEKLRSIIANQNFKTIGKRTCSFGVSEFMFNDTSKEDILKRADKALYEAKNSGKNKVVLF